MENNAPNYAEWIPEAGGYVANGKVVSKSPQYDNDGKFQLSVDTTVFGNTNPQPSTIKAQPQSANNPLSNNGITTANTQGSNEDVNSLVTNIGSMESLNDNTATTGSAISTPAVNSNIAKINPLTSMDEINQGYQDAVARNDIKAQIDYLIAAQQIDGIDRTQQINNLWRARGEKIRTQDDQYLQRLNQATTPQEYAQIQAEQNAWRDMVGYQDQLNRDFQLKQEELKIDYDDTWNKSINDITQSILQLTGNILNFQYDPMTDRALNMAQAQVQLRMKNQFAATGMYYSSATQYAITQAIQELVPVYEKMAKDELRNNLSMLQQTANYLMNLDEHQFNQWKTQIQMKWQQNDEKRKDVAAAWERMNQLGYADNEVSAILGIPAGTASYEARKYAQEKQDQIDAEERALKNSKALERFKTDMDIELAKEQARLNKEYYAFQVANPKTGTNTSTNNSLSYSELKTTIKDLIAAGLTPDEALEVASKMTNNPTDLTSALLTASIEADKETQEKTKKEQEAEDKKNAAYTNISLEGIDAITSHSVKQGLNNLLGKTWSDTNAEHEIDRWVANKSISNADIDAGVDELIRNQVTPVLDEQKKNYTDDYEKTKTAFDASLKAVQDFADMLDGTKYKDKEAKIVSLYKDMIHDISTTKEFDYGGGAFGWGIFDNNGMQNEAKQEVLDSIRKRWGAESFIYTELEDFVNNKGGDKDNDSPYGIEGERALEDLTNALIKKLDEEYGVGEEASKEFADIINKGGR